MARPYKLAKEFPQVAEAYRNGATYSDIAKAYGVSKGAVRNVLKANNVELRSKGRKAKEKVDASISN